MKKINIKNPLNLIIENDIMLQKNKEGALFYDICFCPHCRTLFTEEEDMKITNVNEQDIRKYEYKCNASEDCGKIFSVINLKNPRKSNYRPYSLSRNSNIEDTPLSYIKNIVLDYHSRGYSYERIHQLTRFSKELIKKSIDLKSTFKQVEECSEEKLINMHLKITSYDSIHKKVRKSLEFGCTYKVIEKLFGISSKTISASNIVIKKNQIKNRVFLSEKKYFIKKKKL